MAEEQKPAEQPDDGKVAVTIDGRELRVAKGTLLVDAATAAGVHVPIYCAHPKMDPVAACRVCLVHVEKMPKLQPACATYVSEGMVATTQGGEVDKAREGVLEFLLLNHPLDCPVCDRGGECDLQDFTVRYGPQNSRFPITDKVHANKAVKLSEHIELDQERCILCWRCTRYYEEITGEKELVLQERGVHTVIDSFNGEPLKSDFQGNLPEVCPVGALTHRNYRFRARPWDLQRTASVCPECSYGCNINVDSRDFEVKRFVSRDNPQVDDMWLCDRGRYSSDSWNQGSRVRRPRLSPRKGKAKDVTVAEAIRAAATQLGAIKDKDGGEAIAVLGSAGNTNEELWLLQRLARDVLGTPHIDHQLTTFDDLKPEEHELGIADIESCSHVIVLGEEPEREAPVLNLRLFKAQHKKGVTVHRIGANDDAPVLSGGAFVGVIADETNREQAAKVASALRKSNDRVAQLTITRDVNGRGAKDMGILPGLRPGYRAATKKGLSGAAIFEAVADGRIRGLVLLGMESLLAGAGEHVAAALAKADCVVAIETTPGLVVSNATVVIPGHSFLEKAGTVTNVEGRVQRIRQALPPATQTPSECRVLGQLAKELGADGWESDPLKVNREIAESLAPYASAGNGGRALFVKVPA